jgi:hypothetical protein
MAELTCPKCGMKYYGAGCPNCDWPAVPPAPGLAQRNLIFGCVFIAWGLFLASQYFFGLYHHNFRVFVGGVMFALAGLQLAAAGRFYKENSRPSSLVVALIFAGFAYVCLYAALSKGRISGGLFFIPDKWNQKLGKFAFGALGSLWAWVSAWGFYRTIKPKPPFKPVSQPTSPNR